MKILAMNPCRYAISAIVFILLSFTVTVAQTNCISVVSTACLEECHPVEYIGTASPNASYSWSISCGTISNPTLRNPHIACFKVPGICRIQVITQEPGQAPETCFVEVEVFPLPQGTLSLSKDSICIGDCTDLNLKLVGTPPFIFQIQANNATSNFSSNTNNFTLRVCPRSNTNFKLLNLKDFFCLNDKPNSEVNVTVLPPFTGNVRQVHNVLCATPSRLKYTWFACNTTTVLSNQECFAPSQNGCYCVVIDNGLCLDTVCTNFACDLVCSFSAPDTICVGDTALIYYTGNGGPNAILNWTINIDNLIGVRFVGQDSLRIKYNLPGCYPVNLNVREGNCGSSCSDTICVVSKPCKCEAYTKNKIAPIGKSGQDCCYDVSGDIASLSCFTTIQILLSDGRFTNVQADALNGWSFQLNGTQQIQYAHTSGFIPPGVFHAGSFCVSGASNYLITVRYIYALGGFGDTCTFKYVFDCPKPPLPPKCDSLFSTYLEKQHTLPAFCCYNLHTDNPSPNCFDKIKITTNSGTFNSIQANTSQGYNLVPGNPQEFSLTHSSGFVPVGQTLPVSFCVSGGNNPVTIRVVYFYNSPQGKDSCSFQFIFDCPGFTSPQDCCDSTSLQINSVGMPSNCCFSVTGNSTKSKCFSKICFTASSGTFSNIIANPGWTASVTPQGFCFTPLAQFIPTGPINPGTFCMTGASNPVTITAEYYDANGLVLDKCKKTFVKECPPPPPVCNCDSLRNQVNSVSVNPGVCCYSIQGSIPKSNCYTQIGVQLSSGMFSNINPGTGWSSFSTNSQNFILTHNSGFVPAGSINPASFCVTGSLFYVVTVHYVYSNNGIKDTCTFRYTFDCPGISKPCSCDSLTNFINQASAVPGLCCYAIQGSVPKSGCYTQMQVLLSSGSFANIQANPNWTATSISSQSFTLNHNSGFIPSGTINPASFCVSGATVYSITVHYFFNNNGVKDTCTFKYTFNCPGIAKPCTCDSLKQFVTQTSAVPGLCCYSMQANVPPSNCFTHIQVLLSSGSFVNVQAGVNWTAGSFAQQSFTLNHNSGFIPSGTINPATFCVTGASVYTITVHYFFNNNGVKDTCTFNFTFDCPGISVPCKCDSLSNLVTQTSSSPGLCCYTMQAYVPSANCFTHIQVMLSSGSFVNVQAGVNWIVGSSSSQSFTLNHTSGNIPPVIVNPASFCVSGSTFYTITVHYFYNNNGVQDTCSFDYTFDCPPVRDTLCDMASCPSGNRAWQTLASGVTFVYDMVVYNCQLIVAGQFNQIGNVSANNIAAWDGTNWTALGQGVNGTVRALAVHNGVLYVGGQFTSAGNVNNVNHIASWNGTSWSHLDNGVSGTGLVFVGALLSTNAGLIAGGQFQNAGLTSLLATNNLALWNGSSWTNNFNTLSNVFNGPVYTLREYAGQLYAAGTFSTPHLNTAKYNGTNWTSNGAGITLVNNVPYDGVSAQYVFNNQLIVGGHFKNADNLASTQHIAMWDGSNWNAMPGGDLIDTIDAVHDFIRYNNKLYAGGAINQMGSTLLNGVGEWDGSNWFSTNHPKHLIWALEVYDSCGTLPCELYSAGEGFVNRWVCLTGSKNLNDKLSFYILPNPAENVLNVIIEPASLTNKSLLRILNVQGKLVAELSNLNYHQIKMDVGKLIPGLYILEFSNGIKAPAQKLFMKK